MRKLISLFLSSALLIGVAPCMCFCSHPGSPQNRGMVIGCGCCGTDRTSEIGNKHASCCESVQAGGNKDSLLSESDQGNAKASCSCCNIGVVPGESLPFTSNIESRSNGSSTGLDLLSCPATDTMLTLSCLSVPVHRECVFQPSEPARYLCNHSILC